MNTFPQLSTARLLLSQPTVADLEDIIFYLNQTSEFAENTLSISFPYEKKDAEFWLKMADEGFEKKDAFIFGIREKENLKLIGGIGLHCLLEHNKAEVGYWLGKPFWNKGYVSEALKEVLKFGFETLKLNKMYASHFIHNPASGKVLIKNGFQHEGILRQEILKNGRYLDLVRFGYLKEDFISKI